METNGLRSNWNFLRGCLTFISTSIPPALRQQSELAGFLESSEYFESPNFSYFISYRFRDENLSELVTTITELKINQWQVRHHDSHHNQLKKLTFFLEQFYKDIISCSLDEAAKKIHYLRQRLFWLPPSMLPEGMGDTLGLAILAQFYGAGLVMYCLFPELCHDLGSATEHINQIDDIVCTRNMENPGDTNIHPAYLIMTFPRRIASRYQYRLRTRYKAQ